MTILLRILPMSTSLKTRKGLSCIAALLFLFCIFMDAGCASTRNKAAKNQKRAPLWTSYETLGEVFSEDDFLARIGSGATETLARMNADSELSFYFSAKIESTVLASESYINQNDRTSVQRQLQKSSLLEGNSELAALRHTDFYFDEKHKSYTVCAYINRNEAWSLIEPKLSAVSDSVNSLYRESQKQSEKFLKITQLNVALQKADEFYSLYFLAAGIVPQKAKEFSAAQRIIQRAQNERAKLKQESVIFVNVQGDDSGRIKTKITEILSKSGFAVTLSRNEPSPYTTDIAVNTEISENGEFFVSYPQISVSIKTADGKTLSSFAKQLEKVASYTKESCRGMALSRIENELEENLISGCINH